MKFWLLWAIMTLVLIIWKNIYLKYSIILRKLIILRKCRLLINHIWQEYIIILIWHLWEDWKRKLKYLIMMKLIRNKNLMYIIHYILFILEWLRWKWRRRKVNERIGIDVK
jgi:hypothetical protein